MTSLLELDTLSIKKILKDLLRHDVEIAVTPHFAPHPGTLRGLVTNDNRLTDVIGGDLAFAHHVGAALAMIPAGIVREAGTEPNESWLEAYGEVANVLSRVVNEASRTRRRIDPGLEHQFDDLSAIVSSGSAATYSLNLDGYGDGLLGFWRTD